MLTQKQKDTPYIAIFKLSTGEEIIATVIEDTSDTYMVKSPLCMVATEKGFQFAPLLMMTDPSKPVPLNKALILVQAATPAPELEGQYESLTTGISLPKKSSIITS